MLVAFFCVRQVYIMIMYILCYRSRAVLSDNKCPTQKKHLLLGFLRFEELMLSTVICNQPSSFYVVCHLTKMIANKR